MRPISPAPPPRTDAGPAPRTDPGPGHGPTTRPERVVVVGYGPVAARLVDELVPAVRAGRLEVLVLGAEDVPAYNRVLVADVGVGRTDAGAIGLSDPGALAQDGVRVITGTRAVAVDRAGRTVVLADGSATRYDRLVLATGADAAVPPLAGLDPSGRHLPSGVSTLRDLADAARLRAAVLGRHELLVLGGGVLGLEAALAAAEEGARVTLVHSGPRPMARNLDRGGGAVLAAALRAAGVRVVADAVATDVLTTTGPDGPVFRALLLRDGTEVPGDHLLLSVGVRPRVELARTCALPVGKGVLVDHQLRAGRDGRVFAVGDCAEVLCADPGCAVCPGREGRGPSGLVGPGWRQAEWLARRLGGGGPAPEPLEPERPAVVMLKARGVDLAVAGDVAPEPWDPGGGAQVAQWADPEHGRYVKMVTRAGVLDGLVCVGMPRTAAELVLLYERGAELPADRTSLFRLDGTEAPAAAPPGPGTPVCRCTGATLDQVEDAITDGCSTVAEVGRATRAGTGCGGCHETIRERLAARATAPPAAVSAAL